MEGKPVRAYNITQCRRHCLLAQGEVILESKNCNHPGSHLRAVMALDHSRLGLENKFAENKSGRIFYVRQVYCTKSCQQIWVRVNNLLYFLYITSEVKQYYEALFLSYRPQTKSSISQFFKINCTHSIFRTTEPSKHAWAFRVTVQKISKITYTASWFSLLTSAKFAENIKRVTLQHNKEFWFNYVITMCNASVNSSCEQPPPPPRATAGHLPAFSVLGVGHLQILRCPGAGHLSTPGLFPSFWHARGFLSEYNYTVDITGKKADWLIFQGQGVLKACSRFYACISSLLIKPELNGETRELSKWINVFWLVNQISVDIIWRTSFHI